MFSKKLFGNKTSYSLRQLSSAVLTGILFRDLKAATFFRSSSVALYGTTKSDGYVSHSP